MTEKPISRKVNSSITKYILYKSRRYIWCIIMTYSNLIWEIKLRWHFNKRSAKQFHLFVLFLNCWPGGHLKVSKSWKSSSVLFKIGQLLLKESRYITMSQTSNETTAVKLTVAMPVFWLCPTPPSTARTMSIYSDLASRSSRDVVVISPEAGKREKWKRKEELINWKTEAQSASKL